MRTPTLAFGLLITLAALAYVSPARAGDARTHDGFYLRLGTGLGFAHVASESDDIVLEPIEGKFDALALPGELMIGGSPAPGIAVGGALTSLWIGEAEAEWEWGNLDGEGDVKPSSVGILGPFIDVYFDPAKGLHLQGTLGLARVELGEVSDEALDVEALESHTAGGFGLALGVGYDWWVGNQWSLGILGRLTGAWVEGEAGDPEVEWKHSVFSPGVLFTATFH